MNANMKAYRKAIQNCKAFYPTNRKAQEQYLNGEIGINERMLIRAKYDELQKIADKAERVLTHR